LQTEIGNFGVDIRVEKDILELNISVSNISPVDMLQPCAYLPEDLTDLSVIKTVRSRNIIESFAIFCDLTDDVEGFSPGALAIPHDVGPACSAQN